MTPSSREFTLRAATPLDSSFLFKLYASTRAEEMHQTGWAPLQQEMFLTSQYRARQQSYRLQFPAAETSIIMLRDNPIGAWIIHREPTALRLVDVALLPAHRGAGIGRLLAQDLIAEATRDARPIKAHALHNSRALRFWLRQGFTAVPGGNDHYTAIEWRPAPARSK